MLRRSAKLAVSSVPRTMWDPKHQDARWVDSYAKPMADRRSWPAKVFSIEPEPQTPSEFLQYSKRNLAYSYNAAIRACGTFPETIELYNEMKARGVLVDLDTAFTLVSRAARFERMAPEDVFLLYEELVGLGARCDITVIEVLHTVWEHSAAASPEWREARRRQLVDAYNDLAVEDIAQYGEKEKLPALALEQVARYSHNVTTLGACLRYDAWAKAIAQISDWRQIAPQLVAMLTARAGPKAEIASLNVGTATLEIPMVGDHLRRVSDGDDEAQPWGHSGLPPVPVGEPHGAAHFEDVAVNRAFLAALERVADASFFENATTGMGDRGLAQQIFLVLWYSKTMISADVFAQLLDIVRFSPADGGRRDAAARGLFRRAFRGANMARTPELVQWCDEMQPIDARVVARYLMAVDPWAATAFDLGAVAGDGEGSKASLGFKKFSSAPADKDAKRAASKKDALDASENKTGSEGAGEPGSSTAPGDAADAEAAQQQPAAGSRKVSLTARDVDERMASVRRTIQRYVGSGTRAKDSSGKSDDAEAAKLAAKKERVAAYKSANGLQLITAQLVFLRNLVAAPESVGNVAVLDRAVFYIGEVKAELDDLLANATIAPTLTSEAAACASGSEETPLAEGPETEAWESMLVTLRMVLDATAGRTASKSTRESKATTEAAFKRASELRGAIIEESKSRFNGKFRMLWLEEI